MQKPQNPNRDETKPRRAEEQAAEGTQPFAGNRDGGTEPEGDPERERDFDDEQSADTGALPEWSKAHPEG